MPTAYVALDFTKIMKVEWADTLHMCKNGLWFFFNINNKIKTRKSKLHSHSRKKRNFKKPWKLPHPPTHNIKRMNLLELSKVMKWGMMLFFKCLALLVSFWIKHLKLRTIFLVFLAWDYWKKWMVPKYCMETLVSQFN